MLSLRFAAMEALRLVKPASQELLRYAGKLGFHYIILDPSIPPWKVDNVEEAIVREDFIGENDGRHKYRNIALSKAGKLG